MSGTWDRFQRDGGPPERPFPLPNPRGTPSFRQGSRALGRRPLDELLGGLLVLEHHAAIQPRQLNRAGDDGGQHGLEIQRGADGASDLAEGRELVD